MADGDPPIIPPDLGIVDDARKAAAGTRRAAQWLAAAIGTLPGLAIVTVLIRAPGDQGYQPLTLMAGILIGAFGAFVAMAGFARVIAPVNLTEQDLTDFRMALLPGNRFETYKELTDSIQRFATADAAYEVRLQDANDSYDTLGAAWAPLDEAAVEAERIAKAEGSTPAQRIAATAARAAADAAKVPMLEQAKLVAEVVASAGPINNQLQHRIRLRSDAAAIEASLRVGKRFDDSISTGLVGVVLVAFGIGLLALAPIVPDESKPTVASLALWRLQPEDAAARLGCDPKGEVRAIKVGGTDSKPQLITFPSGDCPALLIEFPVNAPGSIGEGQIVKVIPSPTPKPSPAAHVSASP